MQCQGTCGQSVPESASRLAPTNSPFQTSHALTPSGLVFYGTFSVLKILSAKAGQWCPYLPRSVYPGQMGEVGIHGNSNNFTVHIMKFIGFVTKSDNFCRTHKGAREKGQKCSSENLKIMI